MFVSRRKQNLGEEERAGKNSRLVKELEWKVAIAVKYAEYQEKLSRKSVGGIADSRERVGRKRSVGRIALGETNKGRRFA